MIPRLTTCILSLLLVLSSGMSYAQKQRLPAKPRPANLVLITIDTLRADHVGCYGYAKARTPNLDALCAAGTRFDAAYSVVPTTLPSHTTIMTGAYPMKTGMHDFSGNKLPAGQPTIATVLKSRGYHTGAVVAAAVLDSRFGLNAGFDSYLGNFDFNRLEEQNLDAMERPATEVVDQALKWLKERKPGPFFLWVHIYDPHAPYVPPAPYAERFKDDPYDGEIAYADAQIGRLIEALRAQRVFDDSVIIVTGDHGEGLGEHNEKTHGFFIYDTTLHVPLIVRLQKGSRQQRTIKTPVSLVDLMPTALQALADKVPAEAQGRSLLPLISGKEQDVSELYSETYLPRLHFDWSELRSIRRDNYHFIDGPKPELYDLARDPHETRNLINSKQALTAELRGILAQTIKQNTPEQDLAEKTSLDPAMMERLRSLGYAAVAGSTNPTISDRDLPDPKDRIQVYELVSEGIDDAQHGRLDESIVKLRAALAQDTHSVPIHYLLALNFYKKQDFPAAAREFSEVLKVSPSYALAAYYLGLAQARSGDFDSAIASFKHALELDATNFSAAFNLGTAYLRKNLPDDALGAFQLSVRINPEYAQGHRALGEMLLFRSELPLAMQSLNKAASLAPQDPQVHLSLAKAYAAQGDQARASAERARAQELAGQH